MFRLYKTSEEIVNSDDDDEETDENEEDISIEDKLLKLCKMRICLCRRINKGELVYASNFVDTDWIEESKFIVYIGKKFHISILQAKVTSHWLLTHLK
jgi:hypothetical protein